MEEEEEVVANAKFRPDQITKHKKQCAVCGGGGGGGGGRSGETKRKG